jgi:hypothetical protein
MTLFLLMLFYENSSPVLCVILNEKHILSMDLLTIVMCLKFVLINILVTYPEVFIIQVNSI